MDESEGVFLAGGARTAIGGLSGVFAETSAVALGREAVRGALARSGVAPTHVDEVILGNVLSAGLGQNVARQVSIGAGLSPSVGATTVNKMCGSGLKAVMLAAQAIRCGDAAVVVAGGTENMSQAPYLLENARSGYRLGDGKLVDSMIRDGLWDAYDDLHMGTYADRCAARCGFSREAQDDFAVASYERALASRAVFADEIVPVEARSGRRTVTVDLDEEPQRFDEAKLRKLRPAFDEDGTVTAGNASSINDGAAAILVLSGQRVAELGVTPQARILGYATASREPEWFTLAPIQAITTLLAQLGLTVNEVDLFEINEAFSAVTMAAMQQLKIPHEKVNVHGGAVALGHPIGASGTRTLVSLLNGLERREAKVGIDVLCIGGGEAVAVAVERS
ncbi:MAG TPA: acetyl-CoA C-acetyltransferase [Candidatus Latescibacteria bacterium]|jgi:acetyl-CoA C-acetyltransferase|nr:acetyl-CoA C-acetyltransferase [Candidatus Latescibacterota bacterium]